MTVSDELDDHGQPNPAFGARRVMLRSLDELLGICKGVICDGKVVDVEIIALAEWLAANPRVAGAWPATAIYSRLQSIIADGVIDEDEKAELKTLLEQVAGGDAEIITKGNRSLHAAFPQQLPTILFENHAFCFTGMFAYGPRRKCEQEVIDRAGEIHKTVKRGTEYLVVGTFGSRDWLHSTHGTKIIAAVEQGCVAVPEDHWVEALSL